MRACIIPMQENMTTTGLKSKTLSKNPQYYSKQPWLDQECRSTKNDLG